MAQLELENVVKAYGDTRVIHGLDLSIEAGRLTVLLGPSGCGKSTLLRMIAGLESIGGGSISIDGERVNELPPKQRGCAMVFQNYALYPHKSVYDNMAFPLLMARRPREEIDTDVRRIARVLQLEDYLQRLPRELSGGQRQRVAMGRAMIREPRVFLFDEPLSNLDAELRVQMRMEIAQLQRSLGATMVFVTHDQVEAMTLADKIVIMRAGVVEQQGTPREVYRRPVNRFVAGFIGAPAMSFLDIVGFEAGTSGCRVMLGDERSLELPYGLVREPVMLGVRPEHLRLMPPGSPGLAIDAGRYRVVGAEHLGDRSYTYLSLPFGDLTVLRPDDDDEDDLAGDLVIEPNLERMHFFDAAGRAIERTGS